MKCYHGTTKKGLNAILNNVGMKPTNPWLCSDNDGVMYVWPEGKLIDDYGFEDKEQFICHAFESAEVQTVVTGETDVYVIEMEIPDHLLGDDFSAENMSSIASCLDIEDFSNDMIENIYSFTLNKWNAPFIVATLLDNEYFNSYSVDEDLLLVATAIKESGHYREPTEFYDYNEYPWK